MGGVAQVCSGLCYLPSGPCGGCGRPVRTPRAPARISDRPPGSPARPSPPLIWPLRSFIGGSRPVGAPDLILDRLDRINSSLLKPLSGLPALGKARQGTRRTRSGRIGPSQAFIGGSRPAGAPDRTLGRPDRINSSLLKPLSGLLILGQARQGTRRTRSGRIGPLQAFIGGSRPAGAPDRILGRPDRINSSLLKPLSGLLALGQARQGTRRTRSGRIGPLQAFIGGSRPAGAPDRILGRPDQANPDLRYRGSFLWQRNCSVTRRRILFIIMVFLSIRIALKIDSRHGNGRSSQA